MIFTKFNVQPDQGLHYLKFSPNLYNALLGRQNNFLNFKMISAYAQGILSFRLIEVYALPKTTPAQTVDN